MGIDLFWRKRAASVKKCLESIDIPALFSCFTPLSLKMSGIFNFADTTQANGEKEVNP